MRIPFLGEVDPRRVRIWNQINWTWHAPQNVHIQIALPEGKRYIYVGGLGGLDNVLFRYLP